LTHRQTRGDFVRYMKSGDHPRAHERGHPGLDDLPMSGGKLEQFHVVVKGGDS